jgi:hypothetical protein
MVWLLRRITSQFVDGYANRANSTLFRLKEAQAPNIEARTKRDEVERSK